MTCMCGHNYFHGHAEHCPYPLYDPPDDSEVENRWCDFAEAQTGGESIDTYCKTMATTCEMDGNTDGAVAWLEQAIEYKQFAQQQGLSEFL